MKFPVLRLGSRHPLVERIKLFLVGKSIYTGKVDTTFDALLEDAVERYQKKRKIGVDGVVGNQTLRTMITEGLAILDIEYDESFPPRPTGLTPLTSNSERMKLLGEYRYRSTPEKDNPEAITILGDWEDKNIVSFVVPQLGKLGLNESSKMRMHRRLEDRTRALWAAWEAAGLLHLVLSYDGGFVARFIRGSRSVLSNHAFGSAFDINYAWNMLGHTPAFVGQRGSVRELVLIANRHGFYWGGHFNSRPDGMHFEASKEALQD